MSEQKQLIFGLHAVKSALMTHPERVVRIRVLKARRDQKISEVLKEANANGIQIEEVTREVLDQAANDGNHQGIIAYCKQAAAYTTADMKTLLASIDGPPLILILDGVQDPHNLGACFRTADAAGVHFIIAPKDKSVGITSAVRKVACGAVETVPFIQVTNLVRAIEELKERGVWIYGAAGEAEQSIFDTDLSGPSAIVLGAEGAGLRRLTREHCDVLMKIPMQGSVESLNVSVATGVILFEAVRSRN